MSMIELVFAIIIMGIVVMSLPLILMQTQSGSALALEQETILAIKTRLTFILSHEWDTNSYDSNVSMSRVLDTNASTSADSAFYVNDTNSTRRSGHVKADERRRLRDDRKAPTPDGGTHWQASSGTDIDDFDDNTTTATVIATDMDYIFDLNLSSTVNYITDSLTSGNYNSSQTIVFTFNTSSTPSNATNIKMISVASSINDHTITLRAFATNIGESGILKRSSW